MSIIAALLIAAYGTVASGGSSNLVRTDYTVQSAHARGQNLTAFVTTGVNLPASALVLVIPSAVGANTGTATGASITCTSSGFTLVSQISTGSSVNWQYGAAIFTFQTTTATTGTTFSLGFNNGSERAVNTWDVQIIAFTGFNATTPTFGAIAGVDTDGTGAASVTLTSAPATGDVVIGVNCSINNTSGAISTTPGTGWTEMCDTNDDDSGHFQVQRITGVTSTSVSWVDVGTPSGVAQESRLLGIVVKSS